MSPFVILSETVIDPPRSRRQRKLGLRSVFASQADEWATFAEAFAKDVEARRGARTEGGK